MHEEDRGPEDAMPREALAVDYKAAVAAVNLNILPFWPANPEVWFAQMDAQFTTRGITVQKTKFDYIVASLSHEVATEVRDLILHQLTDQHYNILKEHLIKRTAASEQWKLQQLFNAEELGDRKPTQLLRHMQQVLGDRVSTTDPQRALSPAFTKQGPDGLGFYN